jgi:hypothetical protein
MMLIAMAIVGAVLGGLAGYWAGVLVACFGFFGWLGNLCGLVGVFVTGPLGILVGIVVAVRGERKYQKRIRPKVQ